MRTLHLFNPEHDIALAANLSNFTAPRAGRLLRADLGFLPLLWAEEGDRVVVDDVEKSVQAWRAFCGAHASWLPAGMSGRASWLVEAPGVARDAARCGAVAPWGWDLAVRRQLERWGIASALLPSPAALTALREASHRRTAARLLSALRPSSGILEAFECRDRRELVALSSRLGRIVVKSPWSSSGRGVRFLADAAELHRQMHWMDGVLRQQQSLMVEPYYNKVCDFGMEFEVAEGGIVRYLGLSLFHTEGGAYVGNLLASESLKLQRITRYVSEETVADVRSKLCRILPAVLPPDYRGPLGIDMMVIEGESGQRLLHPCVELNLRRTMGHVALALTSLIGNRVGVMRVDCGSACSLRILPSTMTDHDVNETNRK